MARSIYDLGSLLQTIIENQDLFRQKQHQMEVRIMAAIDDLNAVVAKIQTDLGALQTTAQTAVDEIKALKAAGDWSGAIAAAVASLTAIDTQVGNINTNLASVETPVTPPAPAPPTT